MLVFADSPATPRGCSTLDISATAVAVECLVTRAGARGTVFVLELYQGLTNDETSGKMSQSFCYKFLWKGYLLDNHHIKVGAKNKFFPILKSICLLWPNVS